MDALIKPVLLEDDAAQLIRDGQTVALGGSGAGNAIPEAMLRALGKRFRATQNPTRLTVIHPFGVGDKKSRGLEHIADPNLVRRVIGGHWLLAPTMSRLALGEQIEAYCLPAGVIVQLFQAAACGSPGYLTEVGLGTFVDPRQGGGKLNSLAEENVVTLFRQGDREYLFYRTQPIDVALIKAEAADEHGNLIMDREVAPWHNLAMAQAARANGGTTIAQVRRIEPAGSFDPRRVRVPGIFVDYLVEDATHGMSYAIDCEPAFCGEGRKEAAAFAPFPFSLRKVIARRAAQELRPGAVINVGFGMPDGVMKVARERGIAPGLVPTIEQGPVGGIPADGLEFGASYNADAILETNQMMTFYHGTGVDIAFLGFVEIDRHGNVNVSRMQDLIIGPGGFIDICHRARKIIFCGTLAVKGEFTVTAGKLAATRRGSPKFVDRVQEITFNGTRGRSGEQEVLYVTEAAVFRLRADGLELIEVAPGLDVEADVLSQMAFRPHLADGLRSMDFSIFAAD